MIVWDLRDTGIW